MEKTRPELNLEIRHLSVKREELLRQAQEIEMQMAQLAYIRDRNDTPLFEEMFGGWFTLSNNNLQTTKWL